MAFTNTVQRLAAALLAPLLVLALLAATAPLRAEEQHAPALWKIEDADSEIWLFGTVHILNPALQWRTDAISDAFTKADTLIVEAPAVDIDPAVQQQLVMKYGLNTTGNSFIDELSDEGRANFVKALVNLGQPANAIMNFAPFRPWLAGVTVQVMQIQARGGHPDAGVDTMLWREAKEAGKELAYFETLEEQMQVFGGLSPEDEIHFFEEGMRQLNEEPELLDHIVESWKSGDVDGLGAKMQAAMVGQDALYDALLTNRNKNWAAQIDALLEGEGKIFIAVGAAHLAGDHSVQDLLEADYGIKAVRQ
ncbi:MAG: TraB/GumN family protein [Alphaproteobacteria bacterium]|nr:TraB/GumN family protein [Alphaproteobacteria bacterium]